jgi:hypothetical protein
VSSDLPGHDRAEERPESGLQPERTALAWTRTLMAYLAVCCIVLRFYQGSQLYCDAIILYMMHVVAVIAFTIWRTYGESLRGLAAGHAAARVGRILWLTVNFCISSGFSIGLILTSQD